MKIQQQHLGVIFMGILRIGMVLFFLWLLAAEMMNRAVAADVRTYEITQVDPQPVLQKAVRVRLPSAVRKRGGEITLRFLVTKEGKVENISVVKFSDSDLVDPVYSAYEKAVYSPGLKDGNPVDTWVTITEKAK